MVSTLPPRPGNKGESEMTQMIKHGFSILLAVVFFSAERQTANGADPTRVDVVVYGATPAGVAAAVAAAREGAKVALVEPLNLIGGIMSSGLSFSDSNQMAREALGGIFEEFHRRVEKHYQE